MVVVLVVVIVMVVVMWLHELGVKFGKWFHGMLLLFLFLLL